MNIMEKIRSRVKVNEVTGCWEWQGGTDDWGYGNIVVCKKQKKVHRAYYEASFGEIPPGIKVCHRCDNPPCVNPDHLFLGTDADNRRDAQAKGRLPRGTETHTAILNESLVAEIVTRLTAGEPIRKVARVFGVNDWVIADIKCGRSWVHITGGKIFNGNIGGWNGSS